MTLINETELKGKSILIDIKFSLQCNISAYQMFVQKSSTQQMFLKLMLGSDNELLMSEMQKNWGY